MTRTSTNTLIREANTRTYSVCVDCALWVANRDDSGASAEWLEAIRKDDTMLNHLSAFVITGDDFHFRSGPCHGCGSTLAGDYTDAAISHQ